MSPNARSVEYAVSGGTIFGDLVGDAPNIVLLHAGGEQRRVWRPVAERLAAAGICSLAIDQRGHGESVKCDADHLAPFADDLTSILKQLADPPIVVGASLGGFAGILALGRASSNIASALVLVDVVPAPDPNRVKALLGPEIEEDSPRSPQVRLVQSILGQARQLEHFCASITVPVLLLQAEISVLGYEDVARLRSILPALRHTLVEDASHLIARDNPLELADCLIRFCSDLRGRPGSAECWRPSR
jgi:pimeloyl-ACP methyl ester carboxylesterase